MACQPAAGRQVSILSSRPSTLEGQPRRCPFVDGSAGILKIPACECLRLSSPDPTRRDCSFKEHAALIDAFKPILALRQTAHHCARDLEAIGREPGQCDLRLGVEVGVEFVFDLFPALRTLTHATSTRAKAYDRDWQARNAPTETDCMPGHAGLKLRNVVANYPFERSHRSVEIQPNCRHRDHSRLSCRAGSTQLRLCATICALLACRANDSPGWRASGAG
jgi:hypothetical protein